MLLKGLTFLFAILCLCGTAFAAPGDLDTTFATAGQTAFVYGLGQDEVREVIALPDGSTITAGLSRFTTGNRGFLVKYLEDGSQDQSFGTGGKFIFILPATDTFFSTAALTSEGKIVCYFGAGMVRANANGTIDTSFGVGGIAAMPPVNFRKIRIQTDGKIVAGGEETNQINASSQMVFYRFNADGGLDQTFGTNGRFVVSNNNINERLSAFAFAVDGSIVGVGSQLVGNPGVNSQWRALAVKITPGGSLDTAFGNNGRAAFLTDYSSPALAVTVQIDGKIVIGGVSDNNFLSNARAFLLRLEANGQLDNSFGGAGRVLIPYPNGMYNVCDIFTDAGGKVLLVGAQVVARVTAAGSPDPTFGSRGVKVLDSVITSAAAFHTDGRLAVAGRAPGSLSLGFYFLFDINLLMIDTDGAPDSEFGNGGQVVTDIGEMPAYNSELFVQPDGKLLSVGGLTDIGLDRSYGGVGLARFNNDGTRDVTLDGDGNMVVPVCVAFSYNTPLIVGAMQGDKIIAGCGPYQKIVRLNPDGRVDSSFGTAGSIQLPAATIKVAVQPDGKILAYLSDAYLYRYDPNGAPDSKFGENGRVAVHAYSIKSILVQPDGKIIAAGNNLVNMGGPFSLTLSRFNADGSPDMTFGSSGQANPSSGDSFGDYALIYLLASDGKIIMVGNNGNNVSARYIEVARLLPNGQIDVEFGQGGFAFLKSNPNNPAEFTRAYSGVLQSNGKLVIFGFSNAIYNMSMRIDLAGRPDPFWGNNGAARLDAINYNIDSASMKLDQNGMPVIAATHGGTIHALRLQTGENGLALIAGRVTTSLGRSIINAKLTADDGNGFTQTVYSGANGRFYLRSLPTGRTYAVTVDGRRYTFAQPSVNITLNQDEYGVNFVANE